MAVKWRERDRHNRVVGRWLTILAVGALGAFVASAALADEPVTSAYVDSLGYAKPEQAAAIALRLAGERSRVDGFEWGGIIFEYEGVFYYTEPVTSGHARKLNFQGMLPGTATLTAGYHTHPDNPEFSRQDRAQADAHRADSYMLHVPTGTIRHYRAGDAVTVVAQL